MAGSELLTSVSTHSAPTLATYLPTRPFTSTLKVNKLQKRVANNVYRLYQLGSSISLTLIISFQDRFADAKALPPLDKENNYVLTGFEESEDKTVLKFNRKFDTCDPKDKKIQVHQVFIEKYPSTVIITISLSLLS